LINGLFFPEKSHLILTYTLASINNKIIIKAAFSTTVAIEYWYSYTAELYETLGVFIIVDVYTSIESYSKINININTDFQDIINTLHELPFLVSFNLHLHKIRREIGIIELRI